jgi:hypothetical protein
MILTSRVSVQIPNCSPNAEEPNKPIERPKHVKTNRKRRRVFRTRGRRIVQTLHDDGPSPVLTEMRTNVTQYTDCR